MTNKTRTLVGSLPELLLLQRHTHARTHAHTHLLYFTPLYVDHHVILLYALDCMPHHYTQWIGCAVRVTIVHIDLYVPQLYRIHWAVSLTNVYTEPCVLPLCTFGCISHHCLRCSLTIVYFGLHMTPLYTLNCVSPHCEERWLRGRAPDCQSRGWLFNLTCRRFET